MFILNLFYYNKIYYNKIDFLFILGYIIYTMYTLIIVESPAKCKKIEEYLGAGYKCVATYGHLRTINSLKNIDIYNKFQPTYSLINDPLKKKQIEVLRREIKKANEVILSSDLDREGEMISYTIIEIFNLPLNTKRITFNEITETALKNAIMTPKTIDMNLVHSQQARQILDVLVGFKISPILWKLVAQSKENALSAGRCQSPALKLIYDNQKEIENSVEIKTYNVVGYFTNLNLPFNLDKQFDDEEELMDFLNVSVDYKHIYHCSEPNKISKAPPEPFTTSKIQQIASNELHYSPKDTMRLCQTLYELGYITYMRTDCKKYSQEFIKNISNYIQHKYNEQYFNTNLSEKEEDCDSTTCKTKLKKGKKEKANDFSQEAHEAIRPTDISLEELPENVGSKERRMYKLIWKNTLESCMTSATFNVIHCTISAPMNTKYIYKSEIVDFPGWTVVNNKFSQMNSEYVYLLTIKQDIELVNKKITAKVTFKGIKQHYSEARLVQLLEEKGIGRPSTYSSLVEKIQERGYVKKEDIQGKEILCNDYEVEDGEIYEIESKRQFGNEKNKLVIQPLGIIVMEFLNKHFNSILNYEYTSLMENYLDEIAKGNKIWYEICEECNRELDNVIEVLKGEGKFELKIDENNTYIIGKYGPVIKCREKKDGKEEISFKTIKQDVNIDKLKTGEYHLDEIVEKTGENKRIILGNYENCELILQRGKYGLYVTWGEKKKSLKEIDNKQIEHITFDEVIGLIENESKPLNTNMIRIINKNMSIRKGPNGDYIFYKNDKMKKPKFYDIKSFTEDYKSCNIEILNQWIREKYNI
jgi:DNA topoisomerase-1